MTNQRHGGLSELSRSAPEQAICANMVKMHFLDELSCLRNLEMRFKEDAIYTYVGTVLISVNPFRQLPLYTPDVRERYTENASVEPPHVFAIADYAYRELLDKWRDQSVIVSGESGAGKTEATKVLLEYLMEMSNRSGGSAGGFEGSEESLEDLCLYAQTLLEAFGNAKTVRNDNSSRFGKWIEVYFSRAGTIQGAVINTYLLEKSRVVHPEDGERNFHVFYELLDHAKGNPEMMDEYHLGPPEQFYYLNQSSVTTIDGVSGAQEFDKLVEAMKVFGLTTQEQKQFWKTISAILHLGNIKFEGKHFDDGSANSDGSAVINHDELEITAKLLDLPKETLEKALLFRSYGNRSLIYVPYEPKDAYVARDALAKSLYSGLFNYLGQRINASLKREGCNPSNKTIGVLDIFGFEILQTNSFEQLCINFCNERLQSHFNEECFRIEQEEYRAEGVEVEEITYFDNQPCVDLLSLRPTGIFSMIEEEMNTPGGSDSNLLGKFQQIHKESEYISKCTPKEGQTNFKINHYAGEVLYKSEGLLDKSKDALHADLEHLMDNSGDKFYGLLKKARLEGPLKDRGKKLETMKKKMAQPTLGMQFVAQLKALMDKLNATKPHFIKCLKPNMQKQGRLFVANEMLTQLQYTGIVGLCRIRQIGYPERMPLEEFYMRYKAIDLKQKTPQDLILRMAELMIMKPGLWVLGHSKLLMKHDQHVFITEAMHKVQADAAVKCQKLARRYLVRKWFVKIEALRTALKLAVQSRSKDDLLEAIEVITEHGGMDHLPDLKVARALVDRLVEEEKCDAMLLKSIEAADINQLRAALRHAQEMKYEAASMLTAATLLKRLESEQKVRALLVKAVEGRHVAGLRVALSHAGQQEMGPDHFPEVRQAQTLLARLELNEELRARYEAAIAAESIDDADAALNEMTQHGFDHPSGARETLAFMEESKRRSSNLGRTSEALQAALHARNPDAVLLALEEALAGGLEGAEVSAAQAFLQQQDQKRTDMGALMAACRTLEVKMVSVGGIDKRELDIVHGCIGTLLNYDFTEQETHQITEAQQILKKGMQVAFITDKLRVGLERRDYEALSKHLGSALEIGMKSKYVIEAGNLIKAMDREGPAAAIPQGTMAQILEIARDSRWNFHKFNKLRSREQFAKGKYFSKKKTMESMFSFSKEVIQTSMTDLEMGLSKVAVIINKSLLGFTGVRKASYPASYGQDIMGKGKSNEALRDEIYVQLCKHLTDNDDAVVEQRSWILMCLCIGIFSPSAEFELYLLNFLIRHCVDKQWSEYAKWCLSHLEEELDMDERTLADAVDRKEVPTLDYITAVLNNERSLFTDPFYSSLYRDAPY